MPRSGFVYRVCLLALALLLASSGLLVPTAPAFAHDECIGVPNCQTFRSGPHELGRSGSLSYTVNCPSDTPYAHGRSWDKSSSAVTVISTATVSGGGFLFTATNWSPTSTNTVTLYIGCTATRPTPRPPGPL